MQNRFAVFLLAVVCLFAATVGVNRLQAQAATAAVSGTITDSSGASIPGTTVTVRNTGTGLSRTFTSDAQGRYNAPDVAIGDYEIQAGKMGFQTAVRRGIRLDVGSAPVIDFQLPVGQAEQTINVETTVSQVETTTSAVSSLVDQTQMRELPLNGRNFEQLILLAPGAVAYPAGGSNALIGRAATFSVAGARPEGAAILLDGENLQNWWQRGSGAGVTGTSLGIEAIAEFQTLTNTYGAEFGGNGAVINAATKSGTNSFHGSAYDFLRNSALDARGFFDAASVPPFRKNQFGGSVGGPIKKDKLFFFANYEGIQQLLGVTAKNIVPNANAQKGYLPCTALAAPPNGPAIACDPVTKLGYVGVAPGVAPALALYPSNLPLTDLGNGTGYVFQAANQTAHENYILGRIDYTISDRDTIFARYLYDNGQLVNPAAIPLWINYDHSVNQFATLQERHIFNANVVNVFSVSFSRPTTGEREPSTTSALQIYPGAGRQDTSIAISGLTGIGSGTVDLFGYVQNKFTESDDVLWTKGNHNFKFGARFRRGQINGFTQYQDEGSWSFSSLENFMLGTALNFTTVALNGGNYGTRNIRDIALAPYFQDDWKVSRKLTLNLGLRYEWQSNPVETRPGILHNVVDYANGNFVSVPNVFVSNPTKNNWDPRFGFAYDLFGDHKTSLRGGFGIMHDPYQTYVYFSAYATAPPFFTQFLQPAGGVKFPTPSGAPGLVSTTTGTNYNITTTPYQIQWNLNIQRELFKGSVLTVGYVGSRGVHLLAFHDFNPPQATKDAQGVWHFQTARINPNISTLNELNPDSSSKFHALQASFTQRITNSFQGSASYMFSKCIDYGYTYAGLGGNAGSSSLTNPYDFSIDKGLCVTNVAHNLVVNGVYALPFKGNRLVSGWQVTGIENYRTGVPYTITTGFDRSMVSNAFDQTRPNYIAGCDPFANQTVQHWFNPLCYSLQPAGTIGNAGRSTGTSPGFVTTDLSLTKDTRITEQLKVQFRAEFFNIFNHTNLAPPSVVGAFTGSGLANTASAGAITSIVGTSRQIQFGLKFLF